MSKGKAKKGPRATCAAERPSVLPLSLIEASLVSIAQRLDLEGMNAADYVELGTVEGIAHELSHFLDQGPSFESALRTMGCAEANEHEASSLRIEVAALAALGVRVSMRRLLVTANWLGKAGDKPSLAQLQAPLSQRESLRVNRFVSMVITESEQK
jgi:hypothetical protein